MIGNEVYNCVAGIQASGPTGLKASGFAQKRAFLQSALADLKIVQRFIAGLAASLEIESVKRTAERVKDPER